MALGAPGNTRSVLSPPYRCAASENWRMPLLQVVRRARSLDPARAGSNSAARMAIMAMTTSNSIKVKARPLCAGVFERKNSVGIIVLYFGSLTMKNCCGGAASTLVTSTMPLLSNRLFVSFGHADRDSARSVEARTSIPASRLESRGVPLAARMVRSRWLASDSWGGSSFRFGMERSGTDRSKQAPKDVLRTYTFPLATADAVQHVL